MAATGALPPLVPPLRFSQVEEGVYRGAYPSLVNQRFLTRLKLRTVVSLLPEPPTADLLRWCELAGVDNYAVVVMPFKKDEVTLTNERAVELLQVRSPQPRWRSVWRTVVLTRAVCAQLLVTPERQPVYIHCLDGVTVTGTLVMCLRKLQRWALTPIVSEYTRFDRRRGDVRHCHTHAHTHAHAHAHTYAHIHTHYHTHCHTHCHTRTHAHTHTHCHTHT